MDKITERAAELKRQLERDRFAGGDPTITLSADLDGAEIVARVLAAERAGAILAIGEMRYNPGEDLAGGAVRGALGALRSWGFAAARARLDEAAARAHDPAEQQRISLLKALTRGLSALIYVPLDEKLRLGLADLDATLRPLDLLPEAERLHYRDELDRLLTLREAAAGGDPFLDAAWTLVRAQLAMGAGQDEAATLWLLRLAARHSREMKEEAPDGYLADLIARARQRLLAMIEPSATPPGDGVKPPEPVRPRELFNALVARLSADLGRDVAAGMGFFALNEYIAVGQLPDSNDRGGAKKRRTHAAGTESSG